jgi:uncharacterized LabA/DUF88 family protein
VGKNVAVFVDVANIFYAAKAAGVDIDYVTLLKSASAGRDLVRAYAYTGLDPENENQRNFHSFLARHGFRVVSKDIRKYGDGKVKANLDIELVVDMMKTARNLDIAIVVSGDGDFAPAIRAVQEMGVRVEVISFRGNTSSDLIDVADQFTDITALARVEKGSSRSGRRIALDEQDLSMTEVPDKQTEGATARGRGRGRTRGRTEAEPVMPAARAGERGGRAAQVVALPGERLSKAAAASENGTADVDEPVAVGDREAFGEGAEAAEEGGDRRRRRRRGGRGRGRGRGRQEGEQPDQPEQPGFEEEDEVIPEVPRGPRPTPFGSVWDTQLGVPAQRTGVEPLPAEDEDFEEPEIPEYLIAERRRDRGGRGRGGRGGRGYAAAIERERFGRGGGGGINRYPDVSGRERGRPGRDFSFSRQERRDRPERAERPRGSSNEPWSEVPPELEAVLRAQIQSRPKPASGPARGPATTETPVEAANEPAVSGSAERAETAEAATARPPRRGRRVAATAAEPAAEAAAPLTATPGPEGEAETPRRRTTRRTARATAEAAEPAGELTPEATPEAGVPTTTRRTTRRRTAGATKTGSTEEAAPTEAAAEPAPRRTTRRRTAATAADAGGAVADPAGAAAESSPRRRTTRRKATGSEDGSAG